MSEEKELEKYVEDLIFKYMPKFYTYKGMRPKADIPTKGSFGELYAASDTKEIYLWQPVGEHWNTIPINEFENRLKKMVKHKGE